jgi:hypothetical protein
MLGQTVFLAISFQWIKGAVACTTEKGQHLIHCRLRKVLMVIGLSKGR